MGVKKHLSISFASLSFPGSWEMGGLLNKDATQIHINRVPPPLNQEKSFKKNMRINFLVLFRKRCQNK